MDGTEKHELNLLDFPGKTFPNNNNRKTNLDRIWKDFSSYCTLHGLHFVFEGRPKFQRLIWALLLMSMFGLFVWQTATLVLSFFEFKVTSTFQLINGKESTFPAVTICNFNRYRKSSVDPTFRAIVKQQKPLYENGNITSKTDWSSYTDILSKSMEDIVRSAGHRLEYNYTDETGMLYNCEWKEKKCLYTNFTSVLTDMGVCYTFNSGRDGRVLSVNSPGNGFGIKLTMSVEQEEYFGHDTFSAGLRIRVHDQGEPPLVRELGFAVMPGSHVFASLTRKRLVSLPAPYETKCYNQDLYNISSYTVAGCQDTCKEIYLTRHCKCRSYNMRDRTHPLCNVKEYFECIVPKEAEFSNVPLAMCNCTEPCDVIKYNAYLSYGRFPSNSANKLYANGSKKKEELYRNNVVRVDIFYEDLYYNIIKQVPAYTLQSLLGEIGGLLGLFLGASTLTVVEFIDLGIVAFLTRLGLLKPYHRP